MSIKDYLLPLPIISVASSSLTGTYALAGVLLNPVSIFRIINISNQLVQASFDGINDHDVIPSTDVLQLSLQANSEPQNHRGLFRKNTPVFLKGTAGTGNIYITGYYHP